MHFQLPQALIEQVADYDAVLKPIYKAKKAKEKDPNATPRMSLGVPDNLFPIGFADRKTQTEWAVELNVLPDRERCKLIENRLQGTGLLMYIDSTWYALWFWNPGFLEASPDIAAGHDYIYGCSVAYRTTASSLARNRKVILGWDGDSEAIDMLLHNKPEEVKYSKTSMFKHTIHITAEHVIKGCRQIPLDGKVKGYTRKTQRKNNAFYKWKNALSQTIKQWEDCPNMFDRIAENGDIRQTIFKDTPFGRQMGDMPLRDLVVAYCKKSDLKDYPDADELLQKPFFSKEINNCIANMIALRDDDTNASRGAVRQPLGLLHHRINLLGRFLTLYPDASVDYCQQVYNLGDQLDTISYYYARDVISWVGENVPVTSFIQILKKKAESAQESRWIDSSTGTKLADMQELNDVFSMIRTIGEAQRKELGASFVKVQIARPDRWRLSEWHDHLSAECFKLSTPNERLRQDLMPEPIKVTTNGGKWTFFQPIDVHQLAQWGKAVRNCVGAASSYRDGIKKKTHFIVLAMLDSKPRFTIQLKLRNGVATVEQIADIANRRLNDTERSDYEVAFQEAILIRTAQLTPAKDVLNQDQNVLC